MKKKTTTETNVYKFERDTVEYQLMAFAAREIRFRTTFLGQTMAQIARDASSGDKNIAATTVSNLANGKTKHPQFRTLIPIMMALGFEFDMIQSEVRETMKPEIGEDGKVVPLKQRA